MGSNFCKKTRELVFNRTNGRCFYCGCELTTEPFVKNEFVIDHVIPKICGGKSGDNHSNLVAACRSCNSSKGPISIAKYRRYVSRQKKFNSIGVSFSDAQVDFIESSGFSFCFKPVVFFGEEK